MLWVAVQVDAFMGRTTSCTACYECTKLVDTCTNAAESDM